MRLILASLIFAVICLSGCTRAPPTIEFWTMKTVWNKPEGEEQFASAIFFVTASDPDGMDDLDELRLYHDDEGLLWRWTEETWTKIEDSGRTWIGSKQVRMPQGENFPSGQYKAVVLDKAGEQGHKIFGFDPPKDSKYKFPSLKIKEGNWTVVSDYPDNYFLCYHSDGVFRNIVKIEKKNDSIVNLRLSTDVASIALWADDPSEQISAVTMPIAIH